MQATGYAGGHDLIVLLKSENENQSAQRAAVELEKVKGELEDEEKPDSNRITKWLKKSKDFLGDVKMTKELFDTAKGVYDSFNVGQWLDSIGSIIT
jgi:hypothetical protein